jgi:hypothetical protein
MLIAAPNQVVRGADAAIRLSGTRGSVKYAVEAIGAFFLYLVAQALAGIVAGVSFLALNPDDRCVGHADLSPC